MKMTKLNITNEERWFLHHSAKNINIAWNRGKKTWFKKDLLIKSQSKQKYIMKCFYHTLSMITFTNNWMVKTELIPANETVIYMALF